MKSRKVKAEMLNAEMLKAEACIGNHGEHQGGRFGGIRGQVYLGCRSLGQVVRPLPNGRPHAGLLLDLAPGAAQNEEKIKRTGKEEDHCSPWATGAGAAGKHSAEPEFEKVGEEGRRGCSAAAAAAPCDGSDAIRALGRRGVPEGQLRERQ